jgi:hypothetical protein
VVQATMAPGRQRQITDCCWLHWASGRLRRVFMNHTKQQPHLVELSVPCGKRGHVRMGACGVLPRHTATKGTRYSSRLVGSLTNHPGLSSRRAFVPSHPLLPCCCPAALLPLAHNHCAAAVIDQYHQCFVAPKTAHQVSSQPAKRRSLVCMPNGDVTIRPEGAIFSSMPAAPPPPLRAENWIRFRWRRSTPCGKGTGR